MVAVGRTIGHLPGMDSCVAIGRRVLACGLRRVTGLPLVMAVMLGCQSASQDVAAPAPPLVTITRPQQREVIEWDEYTGRLQAIDSVEVRAQVSGFLQAIHFEDGAMVEKGALLFVIDPRPYEAAFQRSRAELDLAEARLALSRREMNRSEQLLKQRSISEEEADARSASVRQAEASVAAARAALQAAQLTLDFTRVTAPIRGRVGRHLVDTGNLVTGGPANATLLTTIVSLDPIHCYFEADERSYLKYARLAQAGMRPDANSARKPVQIGLADEVGFPHTGWIDFVDNQLDPNTGTMSGRAVLENPDMLLVPGLFVRLRLIGNGPAPGLLVPDIALGNDQAQKFVWVVNPDNRAERRRVVTGPLFDGLRVIRDGLSPEDRIVVAGIQRVHAGTEVNPQEAAPATPVAAASAPGLSPPAPQVPAAAPAVH